MPHEHRLHAFVNHLLRKNRPWKNLPRVKLNIVGYLTNGVHMLREHSFHETLVARGVRGRERVLKYFIELAVFNLGWNVLTLQEFLR